DDLAELCSSTGYAHAIAYFCFRDHFVRYSGKLKPSDYANLYGNDRLIRTEIFTLVGLMVRASIDLALPTPDKFSQLIGRTESLVTELHEGMNAPIDAAVRDALASRDDAKIDDTTGRGDFLREPIFYGGESAHSFQYRDLSEKKYARDAEWFKANKGFS